MLITKDINIFIKILGNFLVILTNSFSIGLILIINEFIDPMSMLKLVYIKRSILLTKEGPFWAIEMVA